MELVEFRPTESRDGLAVDACPPELTDGWLVHTAALQAGYATLLFPGQAMLLADGGEDVPEGSFVHGVPHQTQLAAATFVQDRRVRRAMLEKEKIPVPRGATFSLGGRIQGALGFAKRLGFPLVLKPMVGDNTIETRVGLKDSLELTEAIDDLRVAPQLRADYTSASYAFTAIHTPREDDSTKTRGNYRYLIEDHLHGRYVRFLLVNHKVVSVFESPGGAWDFTEAGREVLGSTHSSLLGHAERTESVFPGLAVTAVDMVLEKGISVPLDSQNCAVVEVSERPWLAMQASVSPEWSLEIARAILAQTVGLSGALREPTPTVDLDVRWQGVTDMEGFLGTVREMASTAGVTSQVEPEDIVGGIARGRLSGPAATIALFNELAVAGHIGAEQLVAVECIPH